MERDISLESRLRQSQVGHRCYESTDPDELARLKEMVKEGTVLSPAPQLFARSEYWADLTEQERALHCMRAIQRSHVDCVFASMSAGLVWGLAVPDEHAWPLRLAKRRGNGGWGSATLMRQAVEHDEACLVNQLRVTSFIRTVFDCLRELEFEEGLVLADSALAARGLTSDELVERLEAVRKTTPGGLHAVEIARYAKPLRGGGAQLHARAVTMGYELPDEPDAAWVGLQGAELAAALDAAGVPRKPGGLVLENPDPWVPAFLKRLRKAG